MSSPAESNPALEYVRERVTQAKEYADILEVASRYCELQRQNGNYKAKVNPLREEKTSSLLFYPSTQKWHDFGSGESGDVFDFIQKMEGCTRLEAVNKINSSFIGKAPLHVNTSTPEVVIDSQTLKAEFNHFEKIDFENPTHKEELLKVVPLWLLKEANEADLAFFQSITRYDVKYNTLVVAWYENTGEEFIFIGYKWRRKAQGKWVNRAGTHPNSVAFSRTIDIHKVYVIEGAHDALTAVLLGISFIALPTTAYNNQGRFKSLLRDGVEVVYIVEDAQGYECMDRLNAADKGKMVALSPDDKKMDLSDFVFTQNSIEEVLNGL